LPIAASLPLDSAVVVQRLVHAVEPWRELYSNSPVMSTSLLYVHLAALLLAGGLAISADRATLRTPVAEPSARARQLSELSAVHRTVVLALSWAFASGSALLLADLESFLALRAFWIKMALVTLLLLNGTAMLQRERLLRALSTTVGVTTDVARDARLARVWTWLRAHAMASLALWFATLLAGTALTAG
jgi:hypothetical protein